MIFKVKAVSFDDFLTLRYPFGQREDIIYPITRALKEKGIFFDDEIFLKRYFLADRDYRIRLKETSRESLLDDIVSSVLIACGCEPEAVAGAVNEAVDSGIKTMECRWYPQAKATLKSLREKGYRLGLISNTHWRIPNSLREDFENLFEVVTLSYEHGYAKPHPSIFTVTLNGLGVDADECLHVGDDPISDVRGARGVGMKTAFVQRDTVEADADVTIKSLGELTKYLSKK